MLLKTTLTEPVSNLQASAPPIDAVMPQWERTPR
jgi:hypothetical protein